jgi:hypothetical protein
MMNTKGQLELGAAAIIGIIIASALALVILFIGGALSWKIIQLLFFQKYGSFPFWALAVVAVLAILLYLKAKKKKVQTGSYL